MTGTAAVFLYFGGSRSVDYIGDIINLPFSDAFTPVIIALIVSLFCCFIARSMSNPLFSKMGQNTLIFYCVETTAKSVWSEITAALGIEFIVNHSFDAVLWSFVLLFLIEYAVLPVCNTLKNYIKSNKIIGGADES